MRLPFWLDTTAMRHTIDAVMRGDTVIIPEDLRGGPVAETVALVLRGFGGTVIFVPDLAEVTTRERVEA